MRFELSKQCMTEALTGEIQDPGSIFELDESGQLHAKFDSVKIDLEQGKISLYNAGDVVAEAHVQVGEHDTVHLTGLVGYVPVELTLKSPS